MKYIGHYDQESKKWVPEKLPTWLVVLLITMVVISLAVLAFQPGAM